MITEKTPKVWTQKCWKKYAKPLKSFFLRSLHYALYHFFSNISLLYFENGHTKNVRPEKVAGFPELTKFIQWRAKMPESSILLSCPLENPSKVYIFGRKNIKTSKGFLGFFRYPLLSFCPFLTTMQWRLSVNDRICYLNCIHGAL